jgi:hypothetical protein
MWLAACAVTFAAAPALAQQPKVLKVTMHADVRTLDPFWTTQTIAGIHGLMIYDTLFSSDAELKPQPQMVDTWTVSDDRKTYTFNLRDGLTFHDGTKVTSKDVVASMNRWGKRDGAGKQLFNYTESLIAKDDKTLATSTRALRIAAQRRTTTGSSRSRSSLNSKRGGSSDAPTLSPEKIHHHILAESQGRGEIGLSTRDLRYFFDESHEVGVTREHEGIDQDPRLSTGHHLAVTPVQNVRVEPAGIHVDATVRQGHGGGLSVRHHDDLAHLLLLRQENTPCDLESLCGIRVEGTDLSLRQPRERDLLSPVAKSDHAERIARKLRAD